MDSLRACAYLFFEEFHVMASLNHSGTLSPFCDVVYTLDGFPTHQRRHRAGTGVDIEVGRQCSGGAG